MSGGARAVRALVRKDLVLELRGREVVPAMAAFALAAFALFRFGLGGRTLAGGTRAAVGLLWVATVFTAMLGLLRAFAAERESRLWDGLLGAPIDRAWLWLSRALSLLVFLIAVQVVALPLFWLFFLQEGPAPSYPVLIAALVLCDVGMAALGAMVAGLASGVRTREVLLPVLFLPFAVPLVLVCVSLTTGTISPQTSGFHVAQRLAFLALYDTIFALLGWALFEYVVEE
ncbi:MAG: heme exporter protein CcmB [Gaiellales bacterium]